MDLKDYIENDFLLDLVKSESKKLYEELKRNRLEVILIPAPYQIHSCHMIRAVNGQNPDWYRNLYAEDNKLKRNHTLKYLERISKRNS